MTVFAVMDVEHAGPAPAVREHVRVNFAKHCFAPGFGDADELIDVGRFGRGEIGAVSDRTGETLVTHGG